ncbi:acetate kinase [Paramyrothecium foliicola]|nr:acetate kinase [Paramyrothecium foliicola]
MAASSSSGSSFTSSSLGRPPTYYSRSHVSPVDSSWTPNSGISTISAPSSDSTIPQPLDLGPPGYQATITLFQDTPDEQIIYLGPWEVVGSEPRRVLWQCSYQNEQLEHYLPSSLPNEIHPHTLHSRHRKYYDPADTERYISFTEQHRIKYTNDEGLCVHDHYVQVKYEFTSVESAMQFQGDLRRRDLVDFYDVDVAWTNIHGRTDGYGKVRGIGAIQRMKMWRDRYTTFHSISLLANKTDGQYREYDVHLFEEEVRSRDDRAKQVRLAVQGRRGSAPEEGSSRRFSLAHRRRPRIRSTDHSANTTLDPSPSHPAIDIKYLALQFTNKQDYQRFLGRWQGAHGSDRDFQGIPFPPNHVELPSPQIYAMSSSMPSVAGASQARAVNVSLDNIDPADTGLYQP